MASVQLRNVAIARGDVVGIDDINLGIHEGSSCRVCPSGHRAAANAIHPTAYGRPVRNYYQRGPVYR